MAIALLHYSTIVKWWSVVLKFTHKYAPIKRMRIALFLFVLMSLLTIWAIGQRWQTHGFTRTHSAPDGYQRTGLWLWPTIEGDNFTTEDGLQQVERVHMQGYIWQGTQEPTTWRIVHSGSLTVKVDGDVILDLAQTIPLQTTEVSIQGDKDWLHLEIEDFHDINTPRTQYAFRTELRIYERGAFGQWFLIPSYRIFPTVPDVETAQQAIRRANIHTAALLALSLCLVGITGLTIWEKRLWRTSLTWIILGAALLTMTTRLIVMLERASSDPLFHFIVPAGDDNYVLMGQQLLSGQYQLAGTFWPSGPIVWFASIVALFGPQLWKIYVANILLSSAAAGAVVGTAWIAFGQKRIAVLTGLIYALYPPLIFYQTTTQSVVLDAGLIAFAVLFGVIAIKKHAYSPAILFGITIGLAGLSRGIALLLGPMFFLTLLQNKRLKALQLTAAAGIFTILTLLPQVLINIRATDTFSLVPYTNGALTLYSGNNRDADGIWTGRGMAWKIEQLTKQDWNAALWHDIQQNPMRIVELNLRKLGMFWNNFEYVSNVNYQQQGLKQSQLLRLLSLNGRIGMALLTIPAWIGMTYLFLQREKTGRFLFWSIIGLVSGTVLFVIAGRLRVPVLPALSIAAGVGVNALWDAVARRKFKRRLLIALSIAIVLSITFPIFDANLPRKSFTALSETAIEHRHNFNNEIMLLGFEAIQTNHAQGGYFYISLYWQVLKPPVLDYHVFVELADETGRLVGYDKPLGHVTYPPTHVRDIPTGRTFQEGYLLQLPQDLPSVVNLNVGLYSGTNVLRLVDSSGSYTNQAFVTLFRLGIKTGDNIPAAHPDATIVDAGFGEHLTLRRYRLSAMTDRVVDLHLEWVTEQQLYQDFVVFTHLIDSSGTLVAQIDSPQLGRGYSTSALIPQQPFMMRRQFNLPADLSAGTYEIVMGIYESTTKQRLELTDKDGQLIHENILSLGEIVIE